MLEFAPRDLNVHVPGQPPPLLLDIYIARASLDIVHKRERAKKADGGKTRKRREGVDSKRKMKCDLFPPWLSVRGNMYSMCR